MRGLTIAYLRSVSRLTASEHGKLIVTFTLVS